MDAIYKDTIKAEEFFEFNLRKQVEIWFNNEFSNLITEVKKESNDPELERFSGTDIDLIMTIKDKPIAIIELKTPLFQSYNEPFKVRLTQFSVLRKLSRMLQVPVYYIIKFGKSKYRVVKCDFKKEYELDKTKHWILFGDEGIDVDRDGLKRAIAKIFEEKGDKP